MNNNAEGCRAYTDQQGGSGNRPVAERAATTSRAPGLDQSAMLQRMAKRRQDTDQVSKMADLARLAGVSVSSVSRALAGSSLVARERRERIMRLAREHGYVMNTQAQNLRLKRTQTLSVVIPLGHESGQPLSDPFFAEMLGHLADEVTQRGYGMFLSKVIPPMGDWLMSLIASNRSDGIIVIGQSTQHKALEAAARRYRPLVVWGGRLPRQTYCTVGTDNVAGARSAVEHLIRLGRRRIVFLGDPAAPEIQLRYEGYAQALNAGPKSLAKPRSVPVHLMADASYEAMRAFLDEHGEFDAVFAASDVIAISAIRAIATAGLSVPKDVAVVGYDDIALAAHANPRLTTVRQDLKAGAQALVDLLFRRMNDEATESIKLPTRLVVRESSGG
jgi:DNA-binding LacI/PurR family transcriptional regulator